MKTLLAAIAIPIVALASAPTAAQETMEIEYEDLKLETAEGQQELDRRIDVAARKICRYGTSTTGTRVRSGEARACYERAKAEAKQQLAGLRDPGNLGG